MMSMTNVLPVFVYRAFGADGSLLYVGVTSNPALRVGKHASTRPWWPREVRDVSWETYDNREAALAAERKAIEEEHPRYNVTHSAVNRPKEHKPRRSATPVTGPTYRVRAVRWAQGWELHIPGVGVTQARSLTTAERMVRDYIHLMRDVAPDRFAVDIRPELGDGLDDEVRAARDEVAAADAAQRHAAAQSRVVARRMKEHGLTGREIAAVLGVSPQRVSQLVSSGRKAS